MRVDIASLAGASEVPNEDWAAATLDSVIVLDGVSAPAGDTGCKHGTPWFVRHLGGYLTTFAADHERSLASGLAAALSAVADLHRDNCDLSHPGTPSATVAMVRHSGESLEYLVLADSVILLDSPAGLQVISDTRVEDTVAAERAETLRHPVGSIEHAERLQAMVERQRQVRNQPGGYWVAQNDPEAAHHALTGRAPMTGLRGGAVLTDGASRMVDLYEKATWGDLYATLCEHGPSRLLYQVRQIEDSDPEGTAWPRYKRSDDATAAFWQLSSWPQDAQP